MTTNPESANTLLRNLANAWPNVAPGRYALSNASTVAPGSRSACASSSARSTSSPSSTQPHRRSARAPAHSASAGATRVARAA